MAFLGFRVIIVGGGIAGLTLANALERANVNYLVLEGRDEISPRLGAPIAIAANGARILDQLGCYDAIEKVATPLELGQSWYNGKIVREIESPTVNHRRHGYPIVVLDRHTLLETLYNSIQDKKRVFLGRKVTRVDHNHKSVSVQCTDGTSFTGDIVVGADGVHSLVRREMWRYMDVNDLTLLPASEKTAMKAEYRCLYGVSKPTEGFKHGVFAQVLGEDLSFLHSLDKSGRVFWAVFEKMDKTYCVPNIPMYTDEDALAMAHRCLSVLVTDKVKFADLWDQRLSHQLVPLEEAWYQHWTYGRFICIGDSIHKFTPNTGQGGNHSIETAAATANALRRLALATQPLDQKDIEQALSAIPQRRKARAEAAFKLANLITRLEALKGAKERFIMFHLYPRLSDWLLDSAAAGMVGAEKLDFLPDPPISLTGTMAFNQNYGVGTKTHWERRAFIALPLLVLAYVTRATFSKIVSQPTFRDDLSLILSSGQIKSGGQVWSLPIKQTPFELLVAIFSPSILNTDPLQRLQAISFLIDLAPIWLIWILESFRRANAFKIITLPLIFGIAFQLYGIGVVGPVFFFLHYVQSPMAHFASLDWRLVNVAAAKTATVAIAFSFVLPTLAMYLLPNLSHRLDVNVVWQAFPFLTWIVHLGLRKTIVKDTTRHDKVYNVGADLPYIRFAVISFALISAITFNWTRFFSGSSLVTIFIPEWTTIMSLFSPGPTPLNLVSGMRLFLQVDEIACFAAAFLWLGYLVKDLKEAEMTSVSWLNVAMVAAGGTSLAGPGAVVALAWLWREEILATQRTKGSVVPPS